MGGFTILSGFVLGCCLPDSFKKPHSTFLPKWQIFTDREIYILRSRVHIDEPAKSRKKKRIGLDAFKKAVGHIYIPVRNYPNKNNSSATGECGHTSLSPCAITVHNALSTHMHHLSCALLASDSLGQTQWLPLVFSSRSLCLSRSVGSLIASKLPEDSSMSS